MTFNPILTDKELDIITHSANGRERKDLAAKYRVSASTLGTWIERICDKLGADNLCHAIAIAFCLGILTDQDIIGFNVARNAS